MIEHLANAERHWFQEVALGTADPLPWQDDGKSPGEPFMSDHSTESVPAFY
jgi:hypothetical protein